MFNRRHILAAAASLIAPRFSVAQASGFISMVADKSEVKLLGKHGGKTPVWRFMEDQPIAVVRAKQGQELKGRIVNHLEQDIWLHWFGVRGKSDQMTLNVLPGESNALEFAFTPPDAGTFWFGPMSSASQQRDMGLYGMLIVEEIKPTGFIDVPLIFDDWKIDDAGRPTGTFGDLETAIGEGRMGNWFTLNGTVKSHVKIDGGQPARLRVLNAANARSMNILFKGAEPDLIAFDGQPIAPKPLGSDSLKLVPGQRADLLLSGFKGQVTLALDMPEDVVDLGFLDISGSPPLSATFVLSPNPLTLLGDISNVREISIKIEGGAKGGLKSARVGDREIDMRGLLEKGLAWAFNGVAGVGGPPLFEAKKGETLILIFENATAFPQPVHVHGHVWQMIESDGVKVDAPIWRDTAVVPGLSKVKLAMVADNAGLWVIQSLIAERVDAGLLGAFTVVEMP